MYRQQQTTTSYQDLRKAANASTVSSAPPIEDSRSIKVAFAAVAFFAFCLSIAGSSTKVFTKNTDQIKIETTLWKSTTCPTNFDCSDVATLEMYSCTDGKDRQRALQAFAVLSCMFSAIALIVSSMDLAFGRSFHPLLPAGMTILTMFSVMIEFSMMSGLYHSRVCDVQSMSSTGYKLSGSFALFTCLWFVLVLLSLYYAYHKLSALLSQSDGVEE